jgi:hypothetical protein
MKQETHNAGTMHSGLSILGPARSGRWSKAWTTYGWLARSWIASGRALQRLWYDRPVRTQLLVAVGAINLLAAVAGGAVSILNTRTATRVEIEASLEVAQRFVGATIKDLAAQGELDQLDQQFPLQLKHLRHVRILIMDTMGQLTVVSPQRDENSAATRTAPAWFAALVRPQLVGRAVRVVAADEGNPVVIVGEPADEIAEAWQDFYSLALVWLLLDALILAVLFVVLGRVLDPLANRSRGMLNLEDGHYARRPRSRSSPSSPIASTRWPVPSIRRATRTAASISSSSRCKRRSVARSPTSCMTKPAPACSASRRMPPR